MGYYEKLSLHGFIINYSTFTYYPLIPFGFMYITFLCFYNYLLSVPYGNIMENFNNKPIKDRKY